MKKSYLSQNWKTRIFPTTINKEKIPSDFTGGNKWIDAVVPGTVHTDLLNNKLIEDPFYADNENKMYWINEVDWIYETTFDYPHEFVKSETTKIVFEGLDTISKIYLNEKEIGSSKNMFIKYEFDTKKLLKPKNNKLKVVFQSPVNYSRKLEKKYGVLDSARNSERAYIRKAQYSFGWDWGPAFPTMGIWRPVYLLQEEKASIKNVKFNTIQLKKSSAVVQVNLEFEGIYKLVDAIKISLNSKNQMIAEEFKSGSRKNIIAKFEIMNPQLWYPNGSGEQNLYDMRLELFNNKGELLESDVRKVGIRKIELRQKENGKNVFKFIVNNESTFCKGADWIPADSFLPRVTKEKYRTLLVKAKEAGMNMIRVWGGGIYENKIFYDLCDELGLMVWQDFMFACASYPGHKDFISNVKNEIAHVVDELQCHPSIALWCGNNENEWIWYREKFTTYKEMPGYKIYHEIIPVLMMKHDPYRPYWPSSPFGNEKDPNSIESGNRHVWDIWSYWVDYTDVKKDESLFVTEFGFQSPANIDTFNGCIPKSNRNVQDKLFEFHNKQTEGPERLFRFLSSHLTVKTEWEDFIYLTQLNQAFALKTCLEHWRTNRITFGSIIWQINDCWPVSSWAIIDSSLAPKISYHHAKNIFQPVIIHFTEEKGNLRVSVHNQSVNRFRGNLVMDYFDIGSGKVVHQEMKSVDTSDEWSKVDLALPSVITNKKVFIATLLDENNKIIYRDYYSTLRWKHVQLPKPKIKIKVSDNEKAVILKSEVPLFFVDLYHPGVTFSDRGFIMLPGEEIKINYETEEKISKRNIKVFSLNSYLQK